MSLILFQLCYIFFVLNSQSHQAKFIEHFCSCRLRKSKKTQQIKVSQTIHVDIVILKKRDNGQDSECL